MAFYEEVRGESGFDAGVQRALQRLLMSPEFLVRIERDPADVAPGTNYRITDLELASRLSFFLWSSIPDEELLDLAERNRLKNPAVLRQQVSRLLADQRSKAFVTNFTGQWLYLRNVRAATPDSLLFPDFDDNLRQALQRETEMLFETIVREDRSALDLLGARYTFVDERLARHYGIPNVYGSHFRRVELSDQDPRGGLLGQGSILAVTSYPNRTSPVQRGKWLLDNVLGAPPPPPPPNVPDLEEKSADGKVLSMRERMAQHRANPACASCHSRMDLLGLALENFDAVGRFRQRGESGEKIDATGALPDGTPFNGPQELRALLLENPERFVNTLTDRLLTYALGRGLQHYDAPTVRAIARGSAQARIPVLRTHPRYRPERSVSDEEVAVMIISKMALPRRTFLRGLGATMALPLLDAMVPALSALDKTAARPASRLAFVYVPNGAVMDKWTPTETGRGFELSPTLTPLEPFRDQLLVASGLAHLQANSFDDGAGDHSRGTAAWLSGLHAKRTEGADIQLGITADQIAAREIRPAHPVVLPRAGARDHRPRGQLRQRLQLRVHEHALVADTDDAAAVRDQSAQGVPTVVRAGRQPRGPQSRARLRPKHPRLGAPGRGTAAEQSRAHRQQPACRVPRLDPRRRAPHPESRGAQRTVRAADPRGADRHSRHL